MITLPDNPTGAQLADAVRRRAHALNQPLIRFAAELATHPASWLAKVEIVERPRPVTVARIRALLAGDPVPPPPPRDRLFTLAERSAVHAEDAIDRSLPPPAALTPAELNKDDPRPLAWSREPCFRCQIRGDIGCAHQRPFQANAA
ncbi:hypothetical protein CA223_05295 [Sphingomonas koreensis]|uniref:Uncharacterized protein n=1 Tax=Sphingomonas koreensis TaxID=93064 RepID=A0A1L6JBL3_9SPHN|nr:hypothetical protein [Sphingomonas koreensis]APR53331.1 hypothetical protein BRX40_13650 [Sphingomonas koreensis]MDC7809979.1 hypothetical protein [Sphingomonas koreensis]RSU24549.1 hypothetical protein CA224_02185 [Sphingomonas koreensis]RSU25194.1 hypothetical protein CA222_13780 [Sphingomonas koreensis]RSU30131.1 hypothetical protein CA225_05570 [Sphingomonas koreensis]